MDYESILTKGNMVTVLIVLVAIMTLYVLIGNTVKTTRELAKPKVTKDNDIIEKIKLHDAILANEKRVIDRHDDEISDIKSLVKAQCVATKALLNHSIHNGNTDEMTEAANELDRVLINRR